MKLTIFSILVFMLNLNALSANWDSPAFLTSQNESSLKIQQRAGDIGVVALNLFAIGLSIHHKDGEGFRQYLYSGLLTSALVLGGKNVTQRERPDGSNSNSFPSGHSAFSFMASTFITQRYGNKYLVPTYLTSSFVAYSRVASKKHYISDVVAGGFLGVLSSSLFTKNYNLNLNGNKYNLGISPVITNKRFNLQMTFY